MRGCCPFVFMSFFGHVEIGVGGFVPGLLPAILEQTLFLIEQIRGGKITKKYTIEIGGLLWQKKKSAVEILLKEWQ